MLNRARKKNHPLSPENCFLRLYGKIFAVTFTLLLLFYFSGCEREERNSWIRINQLGYLPSTEKIAVFVSKSAKEPVEFRVCEAESGKPVWESEDIQPFGEYGPFSSTCRLDFSAFREEGQFYIMAGNTRSPEFKIDDDVYDGTADFLLEYMRQQRCGYNLKQNGVWTGWSK